MLNRHDPGSYDHNLGPVRTEGDESLIPGHGLRAQAGGNDDV